MPGLPYMQFFVGDWRRSTDVQSLPYFERGIWFEMLCLMHDSKHYGKLSNADGSPLADDELARLLGLSRQDFAKALDLMLRKGVTERNESGALICRRMVRERALSEAKQRAGRAGAESRWHSKAIADPIAEQWHASVSEVCIWKENSDEEKKKLLEGLRTWHDYRAKRAEPPKDWALYWKKQIGFLSQYPLAVAVGIIDTSIRQNWQGLFPPKQSGHASNGTHTRPHTITELQTKVRAIDEQIAKMKQRGHEDAFGWHAANQADAKAVRELKARRTAVQAEIAAR